MLAGRSVILAVALSVGCGADGDDEGDADPGSTSVSGEDSGLDSSPPGMSASASASASVSDSAGPGSGSETADASSGDPSTSGSDDDGSTSGPIPGADALAGYWVWSRTVENGETVMEIELADMLYGAAEDGWALVGTNKVAFSTSGAAHWTYHVRTLSDYHFPGTFEVDGDQLVYHQTEFYSCRHSNEDNPGLTGDRYATWRIEGEQLWLSASGFGDNFRNPPLLGEPPAAEPSRWIVFDRLEQLPWHQHPLLPSCYAEPCSDLCGSTDVLGEN